MTQEYFRRGRYAVTGNTVRAWNRSIQLDTIESVDVGRPIFWMALAFSAGLLGTGMLFGDLLYVHEIAITTITGAGLLAVTWSIGSLKVYSKLTGEKGWAVMGWFAALQQMRGAIEVAMAERRAGTRSSDFVAGDD